MCGIAGIIWADPERLDGEGAVRRALRAIEHRGPDGQGILIERGFAAGMRRLAIIDLHTGDQPIFNETGDVGVLFNGEIYNHRELRSFAESRGHVFRTHSDTEVLVHLYEELGVDMLPRLDGMFAFAIWDRRYRRCIIARDRFGIKPLHLAQTPLGLAFASETKALAAAGWVTPAIAPAALSEFFKFAWIPERSSLWRGVTRLRPGEYVEISGGVQRPPQRYHRHSIGHGSNQRGADDDDELRSLIRAAVKRQLVADVPVGLFLSGGLDSSLIAAVAGRVGNELPCHTIEFRAADQRLDPVEEDAPHARALADQLGLKLLVHRLDPDAASLLPRLLAKMDEPSGDPAMITAYLIAEAARSTTKVLLSGMGADEIAGGYRRHVAAQALTPFYRAPRPVRRTAASMMHAFADGMSLPGLARIPLLRRLQKAAEQTTADVDALAESFATWTPPDLMRGLGIPIPPPLSGDIESALAHPLPSNPLEACLAFDVTTYLPSHNLHYVDKATMAASVEVRVPFLDNALSAYLMRLPPAEKVAGTVTKVALRRAAAPLVPRTILQRSKTGFGAPIRSWLRGDLAPMVGDLLSPRAVRDRGLLDPAGVERILTLFRRGVGDLAYPVWLLLSLEIWCREVLDRGHGT